MKKVLVIVDMQNDFIDENVLGNKECKAVIDRIVNKLNSNEYKDAIIIATRDTHLENYLETQEGKNLPVKHCIKGTEGWEIVAPIKNILENRNAIIVNKPTFGSFDLVNSIRGIETLDEDFEFELCGVCTGICVISNAMLLKAAFTESLITVDSNCCACVTPETHKNALEAMKLCQIVIE
jgi:nicotinamidase-related amidase